MRAVINSVVGRRLLQVIPTVLGATVIVFLLIGLLPGDVAVAIAGENATEARLAAIRDELGLDLPLPQRYVMWLGAAVQGDLGTSLMTGEAVTDALARTLPVTLQIVAGSLVVSIIGGLIVGVLAGMRPNSTLDRFMVGMSTFGVTLPNFWVGMVLVIFFAIGLGWFPATGFTGFEAGLGTGLRNVALPAIALGLSGAAEIGRQLRAALANTWHQDYIRLAYAKGMPKRRVLIRDAMRNALLPTITMLGLVINRVLGGTVAIEAVFGIPGTGDLIVRAAQQRDFPLIQGTVLALACIVIVVNLVVDLSYRGLDPRIKL